MIKMTKNQMSGNIIPLFDNTQNVLTTFRMKATGIKNISLLIRITIEFQIDEIFQITKIFERLKN